MTPCLDRIDLARLCILNYPEPVLRQVAKPVTTFGEPLEGLAHRMVELMHQRNGIGLAAPQVGLPVRLFVSNTGGEGGVDRVFVNPRLSDLIGVAVAEEGCLSLPGVTVNIRRATALTLQAYDAHGQPFSSTGTDFAVRVWQHECDHLDGRLIIDYMDSASEIANRRALKQLKDAYAAG